MSGHWFPLRPEKRNHRRLDIELDVDLAIGPSRVKASTTNISCGGLFLPVKPLNDFSPENPLEIFLNLPDADKPVKLVGEVSRVQNRSLLFGYPEGIAVRFKGLCDENILAIDRFIKTRVH